MEPKRIFSVFISSVKQKIKEERNIVRSVISEQEFLPIGMEGFDKDSRPSLEHIRDKINDSDFLIVICGFAYGSIITDKKCADCELKKCNKEKRKGSCSISYTHFEYLYAKQENKLIYFLYVKNYSNSKCRDEYFIDKYPNGFDTNKSEESEFIDEYKKEVDFINDVKHNNGGDNTQSFNSDTDLKSKLEIILANVPNAFYQRRYKYKNLNGYVKASFWDDYEKMKNKASCSINPMTVCVNYDELYKKIASIPDEIRSDNNKLVLEIMNEFGMGTNAKLKTKLI
jgi:hypothetical protein